MHDTFAHNNRSELVSAQVNGAAYAYDNIDNRESAQEAAEEVTQYTANSLNQYTAVGGLHAWPRRLYLWLMTRPDSASIAHEGGRENKIVSDSSYLHIFSIKCADNDMLWGDRCKKRPACGRASGA